MKNYTTNGNTYEIDTDEDVVTVRCGGYDHILLIEDILEIAQAVENAERFQQPT